MQADLRASHFDCCNGLEKKKNKLLKKRNASAYFGKKICCIICSEEMPEKLPSFPCFICFLKGQVPLYSYYFLFLQSLQRKPSKSSLESYCWLDLLHQNVWTGPATAWNTFASTANANPLERPSVGYLHSGLFQLFWFFKASWFEMSFGLA